MLWAEISPKFLKALPLPLIVWYSILMSNELLAPCLWLDTCLRMEKSTLLGSTKLHQLQGQLALDHLCTDNNGDD